MLFDTGQTGRALLHNLDVEGVSPREVEYLVLSHRHSDHTGGVPAFLEARGGRSIPVVAHPGLFEPAFAVVGGRLYEIGFPLPREAAESKGARFVLVSEPLEILPGVYFSGGVPSKWGPRHTGLVYRVEGGRLVEDPVPDDAFLAIVVGGEAFVLTGCGHAGVENILGYAEEVTGRPVRGIIGGLHLLGVGDERVAEVARVLRERGLRLVAGLHCTGPFAQHLLKKELGSAYRYLATGGRVSLP